MKRGTLIAERLQPIVNLVDTIFPTDLKNCPGCKQMEQDFNDAETFRDYTNAVIDRIRKRGKYKRPNN